MHSADSLQRIEPVKDVKYTIQVQDILEIKNLQSTPLITNGQELGTGAGVGSNYQVEEDGTVALPVIGRVIVAGLTRVEAARKVEELYKQDLLKNPIIDIKLVNLKVTVLGEVGSQGNYLLTKDKTSLVEVLGEAGGLNDKADAKNIKIIRGKDENQQTIAVDLSDIKTLKNPQITLQNNDIIYVAQNKRAVRTDKFQNLSTILQPALIIVNTALIIYTLTR